MEVKPGTFISAYTSEINVLLYAFEIDIHHSIGKIEESFFECDQNVPIDVVDDWEMMRPIYEVLPSESFKTVSEKSSFFDGMIVQSCPNEPLIDGIACLMCLEDGERFPLIYFFQAKMHSINAKSKISLIDV